MFFRLTDRNQYTILSKTPPNLFYHVQILIVDMDFHAENLFCIFSTWKGDFGSAHQISYTSNVKTSRGEPARGTKGCTTHYSPPEVHANCGYGRPCDVWSIGCTVLEMITGKIPWTKNHFETLEPQQVIYQMCNNKINPLSFLVELPKFHYDPRYTKFATDFLEK